MNPLALNDCWYYAQDKKKMGPVTLTQLRSLLATGALKPVDMVFQEGTTKWRPLAEVAGATARALPINMSWKLALAGSGGIALVAFLVWGLVALMDGPNGSKEIENPGQVAEVSNGPGPIKPATEAIEKEASSRGDEEPQRPEPQQRNDLDPKGDAPVSPRERPSMAVQLGHSDDITSVAFSPDGKQIVTSSEDKTARLWDVASGREIRTFQGHQKTVMSVAFSPDGNQLLTLSSDGTIRFWNPATSTEIRVIPGPDDQHYISAVFSPDGKQLLTCGLRKGALLRDAASGKEIRAFPGVGVAFSPNGEQVLTGHSPRGGPPQLWDVSTGKEIRSFKAGKFASDFSAFSPDGQQVFTGDRSSVRLWDAASGKQIREFSPPRPPPTGGVLSIAISNSIRSIAISPDGKQVFADCSLGALLWDVASGKEIRTFLFGNVAFLSKAFPAAFSPDGSQLVMVRGSKAVLFDTASGKEIRTFQGYSDPVIDVAFTPDGQQLIRRESSTALWDTANAKRVRDFKGPWWDLEPIVAPKFRMQVAPLDNRKQRVAVSPDLKHVVTWGASRTVRVWDAAAGREICAFEGDAFAAFSSDRKKVVTYKREQGSVVPPLDRTFGIWDAATGKVIHTFTFATQSVECVALSPDGTQILAGSKNKAFKFSPDGDRSYYPDFKDMSTGRPFVGKVDRSDVVSWDVASGMAIRVYKGDSANAAVTSVGFSPNGKLVGANLPDGRMQIFDAASSKKICDLVLQKAGVSRTVFDQRAVPFAFSPDGTQVLTARRDEQTARLWSAVTGGELMAFEGHTAAVISVAFSPDGKHVLTGSLDGTVRLWDAASGQGLCRQVSFLDGSWAVTTPDNYYMASKGSLQGVAFSVGIRSFSFDQFDLKFNRPDKVLERIGLASPETVAAYRQVYQKRLKRMNFTEDMLSDDFHVPEIAVNAGEKFTTREKILKLKVQATDSKYLLDRVHVDVNGVPLHGTSGISLRKQASKSCQQEVDVELSAGKNKIDVSVVNEKGAESLKETISVVCDAPATKPNLYVVAVGVSDYADDRFRLTYADKDARDLADLFESKKDRFGEMKVLRILNRDATRENILKAKDFLKNSSVDDLVVLFFAGHGLLDSKLDYYFATADMDFKNPASRGLPYEAIEDLLDGIRARKKLLLMDTCHSGELDKDEVQIARTEKQPESEIKVHSIRGLDFGITPKVGLGNSYQLLQEMFADLRRGTGAVVIASAGGAEYALESATWKNGVFTHALLRGLKGEADKNKDGRVQVSELRDFVEQEVRRLTQNRQAPTARRENLVVDFTLD